MMSIRMLAMSIGGFSLLWTGLWPSMPAAAQVVERGVQGGAVGAIIGGIIGGGRGAATGAAIGAGVGVLSGAAEANARAHGYYGSPSPAGAAVGSINIAPPPLPVYEQPLCPGPGYIWTPGYWDYGYGGYYWVPGTWVLPPAVGLFWTPGYWGYEGGLYVWHAGYWGPHVGYYGGVNYGFGYVGTGYEGGYWDHGTFFYNTAVTRVNPTFVTNTYNKTVVHNVTVRNVSFNGGPGGTKARPTPQELSWSHERRIPPTALQVQHRKRASTNRALFASVNHGAPAVTATTKLGAFGPIGPNGAKKPTLARGTPSQTSLGRTKDHTEHKALRHGPSWASPFASGEPGPQGRGAPRGPGAHGPHGPHGPGGPHGSTRVAAKRPGSHHKPKHDQDR
jgi:hypothetical protein